MKNITLNVMVWSEYAFKISKAANELVNDPNVSREEIAKDLLHIVDDISQDIGPECERAAG